MSSMHDFPECLLHANLAEINFEGNEFNWCNNQRRGNIIWQRLYRVLCSAATLTHLPELKVMHLQRLVSDHSPLLILLTVQTSYRPRFIFQKMWLDHPDFQSLVQQIWGQSVTGSPSLRIAEKLRHLKNTIKRWN